VAETEQERSQQPLEGINPELDELNRQLAGLEAELDEQTRTLSDRPRTRRLTSVATREAADAAYLHSFLQRLEAVGNKYYPEASIRYGLYGSLRLLVTVRKNGSLEEIRVLSTSGYAVLDEAAIKTVRMAAPFAPFPAELAATTDRLEIVRTWHFEQNELSSDQGG
jgi:protein TonB